MQIKLRDGSNGGLIITKITDSVIIPNLGLSFVHPIPGMFGPAIRQFSEK